MDSLIKGIILIVFVTSFTLGIHNATLYHPRHGFDGNDHLNYILYVNRHWQLPAASLLKEYHQSPLYYFIGATLMNITKTWKTAQYINIFVLWLIIGMVGLGLWRVFKKKDQVLIGMFSLAALPMLNIFPAMITNELLNTFWVISIAVCAIYLVDVKEKRNLIFYSLWFTINFIIGYWTKVSVIIILPTILIAYLYVFIKRKELRKAIVILLFSSSIVIALTSAPIFIRAKNANSGSNVVIHALKRKYSFTSPEFYFRLDWIPKVDMYNTQYYSFLGAAWNSFWTDGHNAVTPFIKFHKKSFVLWSLGFVLLPICVYGFFLFSKHYKKYALVINIILATMLLAYFYIFRSTSHYSGGRLTYEMGIIIPYAFGIASASKYKKIKMILLILLSIQFVTMVSFYWIAPWWHVTK